MGDESNKDGGFGDDRLSDAEESTPPQVNSTMSNDDENVDARRSGTANHRDDREGSAASARQNESLNGDRAGTTGGKSGHAPSVTQAFRKRMLFGVCLVVFGGFLAWTVLKEDAAKEEDVVVRKAGVAQRQTMKPLDVEQETTKAEPAPTPVVEPGVAPSPEEDASAKLLEDAQRAPIMAFGKNGNKGADGNNALSSADPSGMDGLTVQEQAPADAGENEARRFDNRLKPTVMEGAKAGTLGNRNLIIAMGTSIPCTLETAIATDQPGFTSCIISRDIMSDNGRVVLLDKGTQIVGEYKGGLQRGQKRLFVLWTRAKTPTGVIVQLASPATDALGRAGFDGHVDTHWWERFGSGLLLSMVGDLTAYGLNQFDSESVSMENTAESGKDAAAIAVEQSINIPPTLRKNQGELVSIFVARDLDFSDVYRLKPTELRARVLDRAVMGNFAPESHGVYK